MKFYLYGHNDGASISLDGLLEMQRNEGMLWAHAEDSGSESCYCEVARWNEAASRFERYAFAKCADDRFPELPDATDVKTAEHAAQLINNLTPHVGLPIVHRMPDWTTAAPTALGEEPIAEETESTEEALGAADIDLNTGRPSTPDNGDLFALYDFDRGHLIATEVFSSYREAADEIDPRLNDVIVVRLV